MFSKLWLLSCLLFGFGFLFAAAGFAMKYLVQKQGRYSGRAEARVVDIIAKPRAGQASLSEFRNNQAAVFEFFAGGRLIKVSDPADTYPCPYYRNQKVRISYDPLEPEHFEIMTKNVKMQIAEIVGMLGIILILSGCVLFFFYAARVEV